MVAHPTRAHVVLGVGLILATASACTADLSSLYVVRCSTDATCGENQVCVGGECKPKDTVSCQAVEGGRPLLQPSTPAVDFGRVGSATSMQSLSLQNIGDCSLTVFDAYLEKGGSSPFTCPTCSTTTFPLEIFPLRDRSLPIYFTPPEVGAYQDSLVIVSDDAEYAEMKIPAIARFEGVPTVAALPADLEFDYTAVGQTSTKEIRIINRGSGHAALIVSDVELESAAAGAFSLLEAIRAPVELVPVSVDPSSALLVSVRYHPREVAHHDGALLVRTTLPTSPVLSVPISGSSQTPPNIEVTPVEVRFGPVPLGESTSQILTVVNSGGAPLRLQHRIAGGGASTDFSVGPPTIAPIAPGDYAELEARVTATAPAALSALLLLTSNDPLHPSVTIPMSAEGRPVAGAEVVKVEINFENGEDSVFDDDLRNVDLLLENPHGQLCSKAAPNPADWGVFGSPSWIAFGPKEEPERIILPNASADGIYRVLVSYQEDCASIPTTLLASVLGISVEALAAYLSGGAVDIDAEDIANAIDSLCLDRDGSLVTVTVSINGQIVAERPARLSREGEYVYALDLVRTQGVFSVR